ncbi:MAG: beta-galactosidase, partial [Ruegeria sp.]
AAKHWIERLSGNSPDLLAFADGASALKGSNTLWYLAGFPDEELWDRIIDMAGQVTGLALKPMPPGLRRRETADYVFLINYNAHPVDWNGQSVAACDVAILERDPPGQG